MGKEQHQTGLPADWQSMVEAAKQGAREAGFELERLPGRGLSNVWTASKGGRKKRVSIRTTKNRWIAFPPLEGGRKWKTLDDVDLVIVAAVDRKDNPEAVQVYLFEAADLHKRFKQAYDARVKAGQSIQDDFGMWINLDRDDRDLPVSVGSGIAEGRKPIIQFALDSLPSKTAIGAGQPLSAEQPLAAAGVTIADILADARKKIANLAGVESESVKLELKIEY